MARPYPRRLIGGILLAAGRGTRSGSPNKLLVRDRDGMAMACRSAGAVGNSGVDRVVAVLGHQADLLAAAISATCPDMTLLVATDHADGLAASLRRGIDVAIQERWDAAVLCLADMPGVGSACIDALVTAYRASSGVDAVVPLAAGRRGNPVLWDARMFRALSALRGDRGGRDLLRDPRLAVLGIELGDEAVLADHDTPDDLLRFGRQPAPPGQPK